MSLILKSSYTLIRRHNQPPGDRKSVHRGGHANGWGREEEMVIPPAGGCQSSPAKVTGRWAGPRADKVTGVQRRGPLKLYLLQGTAC